VEKIAQTPYAMAASRGWHVLQDHPLPVVWEKCLGGAVARVEARGNVRARVGRDSGWASPLWAFDRQFSSGPRRPHYGELFEYGDRILRILCRLDQFSLDDLDVVLDALESMGAGGPS